MAKSKLNANSKQEKESIKRQMIEMHDSGKTYYEIGEAFGISRQRVFQMIGGDGGPRYFRYITADACIFNGIRKYMNDNKVSFMEMTRRIHGETGPRYYQYTKGKLNGTIQLTKKYIDKLLEITGLTYEVAFELESEV